MNQRSAATTTMTRPASTRPKGLVRRESIHIVLQHDDRGRAVDARTVRLGLHSSVRKGFLGLVGRQAFIPLDYLHRTDLFTERKKKVVSRLGTRGFVPRKGDRTTHHDQIDGLLFDEC